MRGKESQKVRERTAFCVAGLKLLDFTATTRIMTACRRWMTLQRLVLFSPSLRVLQTGTCLFGDANGPRGAVPGQDPTGGWAGALRSPE